MKNSTLPLFVLALALVIVFHRLLLGEVFFWGLPALQFYPWREYAFDLIRQGQLPLWNPYNGAGAPLLANYQSALLYPFNWLGYVLPLAQTMSVAAVVHLFLAGWGMWRFTGRLGVSGLGRGVSALAFGMTSYLVARLGTYPILMAAAWLPWLLWAALGVLTTFRWRDGAWLALFAGLLLLAGHAQTAWYSLLLVGGFGVWWTLAFRGERDEDSPQRTQRAQRSFRLEKDGNEEKTLTPDLSPSGRGEKIRRLIAVGALLTLGVGIAALQLIPTAELLRTSQRSAGVDFAFAMNFSYSPARIFNLFSPNFFGSPANGTFYTQGAFFEDAVYVGLIPVVSAVAALLAWLRTRRDPDRPTVFAHVPFWWGVVIIAVFFAFGRYTPIFPFLYRHVPTFDLFQAPARWHLWTVAGLSVLAGIGVSAWGRGVRLRAWTKRLMMVCIGAGSMALFVSMLPGNSDAMNTMTRATVATGVSGLITGLLILSQPDGASPRYRRWSLAALLFIAADLAWAAWGLNPTVPAAFYDQQLTQENGLTRAYWSAGGEEQVKFGMFFRFKDYRYAADNWREARASNLPNLNLLDRRYLFNNFDPLLVGQFADYVALLEGSEAMLRSPLLEAAGVDVAYAAYAAQVPLDNAAARAWFVNTVCWHTSADSLRDGLQDSAWQPAKQVHMMGDGGCPDVSSDALPPGQVMALRDDIDRVSLDVSTSTTAWLVLADVDYPGWQAAIDGEPVYTYRANLAFRAVQVPPGEHTVTFEYHAWWILPGALISGGCALLTLLLFRLKTITLDS